MFRIPRRALQKAAITIKEGTLPNRKRIRTDVAFDDYIAPQQDSFGGCDVDTAKAANDRRAHFDVGIDDSRSGIHSTTRRTNVSAQKPLEVQNTLEKDLTVRSSVALNNEVRRIKLHCRTRS